MEIHLESDVPIPKASYRVDKYKFGEMGMGQSFTANKHDMYLIRYAASRFKARYPDFNYTTRKISDDEFRVWRIEPFNSKAK